MDAPGECMMEAPPDSFEPDLQWEWTPAGVENSSTVTALVANFTDDNMDDEIDLCDVPDIVVQVFTNFYMPGHIWLLDGASGQEHFMIQDATWWNMTPAVGDVDGDMLPEIVTLAATTKHLLIFEHDGTKKLESNWAWPGNVEGHSMGLADFDNDGDVEIYLGSTIADHQGNIVVTMADPADPWLATTAADLDDDDDLELVLGRSAYHHDGMQHFYKQGIGHGFPQVGDLDDDPEPEVLITNIQGLTQLDHDGAVNYQNLTPTGDPPQSLNWLRPAAIHDFDGDEVADYAMSSRNHYTAYQADATIIWTADVLDATGIAGGTAFDFLGDGIAEAMYADETQMYVFDGNGGVLLMQPRTSRTWSEYPTVSDVDNDGSAEIVVVSNCGVVCNPQQNPPWKTVQVIRDKEDRWIQARRIWNQHTYHVTNVREDATIPAVEPHHWELLNTFRTNAQIEGGMVCDPTPQ
jgi:hypothetical protein